jgi:hypothetical protein
VSFAAITLYVASQQVFVVSVYFLSTQSGKFWIHSHIQTLSEKSQVSWIFESEHSYTEREHRSKKVLTANTEILYM